jgi:histidinol-phosphatase (PHP family)
MQYDTHIHTLLSPDSELEPAAALNALRKKGLGACFTDHVDYVTPEEGRDPAAADAPENPEDFLMSDIDEYPVCFNIYREQGALLGLEIGLTAAFRPLNEQTASKDGLDFIIGSVHFTDGYDITRPAYWGAYPDPFRRHLEYMREMVEACDFFDSLGHIDYISRYSPFEEKEALYADYPHEYDSLFRSVIERDKAIEINTVRFGEPKAEMALYQIYKRYRLLGGKYVTIGSDAHEAKHCGRHHPRALQMARETGLAPVYFKERVLQACV